MSGDETEEESSTREAFGQSTCPVDPPGPYRLFHTMDTWKTAVDNEGFMAPHGNRPILQLPISKMPVVGIATKKLPRNWYNDTWFKSL